MNDYTKYLKLKKLKEVKRENDKDKEVKRETNKIIFIKRKLLNLITFIDEKYNNKYIHFSKQKMSLDILENKNNNNDSWLGGNIYMNPNGLWFSCGSRWIEWILKNNLYKSIWANVKYVYEIKIEKKNILKIKNTDELINFHNKYAKYNNKDGFKIDWQLVKKDYNGIVICPYLGNKIWKNIDINNNFFSITDEINKYIRKTLKKNLIKYPQFYLEWYRHWETSTGVVWKISSVKSINLIKEYD